MPSEQTLAKSHRLMAAQNILADVDALTPDELAKTLFIIQKLSDTHDLSLNEGQIISALLMQSPKRVAVLIKSLHAFEKDQIESLTQQNSLEGKVEHIIDKDDYMIDLLSMMQDEHKWFTYENIAKINFLYEIINNNFEYYEGIVRSIAGPIRNFYDVMCIKKLDLDGVLKQQELIELEKSKEIQIKRENNGYPALCEAKTALNLKINGTQSHIKSLQETLAAKEQELQNYLQQKESCLAAIAHHDKEIGISHIIANYESQKKQLDEIKQREQALITEEMQAKMHVSKCAVEKLAILTEACTAYQNYLFITIKNELERVDLNHAKFALTSHPINYENQTFKNGMIILAEEIAKVDPNGTRILSDKSITVSCKIALLKYNAINQLQEVLHDNSQPALEKLQRFENVFTANAAIISIQRDSHSNCFINIMLRIFNHLKKILPCLQAYNKPKGAVLAENITNTLWGNRTNKKESSQEFNNKPGRSPRVY